MKKPKFERLLITKKCKLCKGLIINKEYEFCPHCGGDWKGGLTRDKCMYDRDVIIPKLEKACQKAYRQSEKDTWYIRGLIEGINWSFDHGTTYATVNILEKKYGAKLY